MTLLARIQLNLTASVTKAPRMMVMVLRELFVPGSQLKTVTTFHGRSKLRFAKLMSTGTVRSSRISSHSPLKNRTVTSNSALKEAFPNGIDLFFDNVGGIMTEAAWDVLNKAARVVICGQISTYNDDPENPKMLRPMLHKLIYKERRAG